MKNEQNINYSPDDIIRLPQVRKMSGLSKSSVYRLAKLGQFPAALKLSIGCVGWRYGDIKEWRNSRTSAYSLDQQTQ